MSHLLTGPTAVLLVGTPSEGREAFRDRLAPTSASEVVAVDDPSRAGDVVDERDDVGCAVVCSDVDSGSVPQACAECRAADEALPVLVYVAYLDLAADLADLGDCRLVPRDAGAAVLRDAVDDALSSFDRRRERRAESSMFSTLLSDAEVPIYVKDDEGRHLRVADVPEGVDPSEAIGRTDLDLWGPETPATARKTHEDDRHVVESGEGIYRQDERFDRDGEEYWSRTTKVPWRDEDGTVQGLVGVSPDVTDHVHRAEQLEEQRERIDRFTRYVSHDLQTPLQVASGALEMAREGDEEALDTLATSLDRMEETIDDLSSFVQRRATVDTSGDRRGVVDGSAARSVGTPQLVDLVRDVWAVVASEAATLRVDLPDETTVTADEESVRPLVENVLKNAVDHAGPDVRIRVGGLGRTGFFVADDGPGIPPDERDAVLEEGYTTDDDGSGTGLSIVAEVADEYGWDLRVTESETGGTRIEVDGCLLVTDPPETADHGDPIAFDADDSVGDVRLEGSAEYVTSIDRWIVEGSGTDLRGDTEEFHLVHGTGRAPVRVQGRVADVDEVSGESRAGFTIRASADEGAPFAFVGTTPDRGTDVAWRAEPGGPIRGTSLEEASTAYEWYRVRYRDGTVTCSLSRSGSTFRSIAQFDVPLGDRVRAGLAVCSRDRRRSCVAQFEGVAANELVFDGE